MRDRWNNPQEGVLVLRPTPPLTEAEVERLGKQIAATEGMNRLVVQVRGQKINYADLVRLLEGAAQNPNLYAIHIEAEFKGPLKERPQDEARLLAVLKRLHHIAGFGLMNHPNRNNVSPWNMDAMPVLMEGFLDSKNLIELEGFRYWEQRHWVAPKRDEFYWPGRGEIGRKQTRHGEEVTIEGPAVSYPSREWHPARPDQERRHTEHMRAQLDKNVEFARHIVGSLRIQPGAAAQNRERYELLLWGNGNQRVREEAVRRRQKATYQHQSLPLEMWAKAEERMSALRYMADEYYGAGLPTLNAALASKRSEGGWQERSQKGSENGPSIGRT